MPRYIITKRIEAKDITDAIKREGEALIVEVTDIEDPESDANAIGFKTGITH